MRDNIPSKCRHFVEITTSLILLYGLIPVSYIIMNGNMHSTDGFKKDNMRIILLSLWLITELAINFILLYVLTKGLQELSIRKYWRYDIAKENAEAPVVDDKQHELAVEATRYNVLFGMVVMVNLFCVLFGVVAVLVTIPEIGEIGTNSIIRNFIGYLLT